MEDIRPCTCYINRHEILLHFLHRSHPYYKHLFDCVAKILTTRDIQMEYSNYRLSNDFEDEDFIIKYIYKIDEIYIFCRERTFDNDTLVNELILSIDSYIDNLHQDAQLDEDKSIIIETFGDNLDRVEKQIKCDRIHYILQDHLERNRDDVLDKNNDQ